MGDSDPSVPVDGATLAMLTLAAGIATGDEATVEAAARITTAAGVSAVWADELLLQSVLMVGWPRALMAARVWRGVSGVAAPAHDPDTDPARAVEWLRQGEATCRVVYGANYERLRHNVAALHPALDAWMITEGYGRTLSRPGLPLRLRELCTVAQCAVLGALPQLHSHLRGARHAGANAAETAAALAAARPHAAVAVIQQAEALWRKDGR